MRSHSTELNNYFPVFARLLDQSRHAVQPVIRVSSQDDLKIVYGPGLYPV
jgi:hypothetical protein